MKIYTLFQLSCASLCPVVMEMVDERYRHDDDDGVESAGDIGKRIGKFLNGIEKAGVLEEALEERGRRAEARLAAFNSALLFAFMTRGNDVPLDCTLSGSLAPAVSSLTMNTMPVWVGVNAFVNVSLRNRTNITIGDGWNLRLSVESARLDSDHVNIGRSARIKTKKTTKQLSMVLPILPAQDETTVSFPITLESHAPLVVSLELYFVLPHKYGDNNGRVRGTPFAQHDLNFVVARRLVLDVFTFSMPVESSSTGVAHQRMRATRLRRTLNENGVSTEPLPLSCRMQLPVSGEELQKFSGRRRTLLGADFTVTVTSSDTSLRATPAVLPFLRAAILRRCSGEVEEVEASGIEAGERWERRVVDAADKVAIEVRDAHRAVAECEALIAGGPETCALHEDVSGVRKAVAMLDKVTAKWRGSIDQVWQPDYNLGG